MFLSQYSTHGPPVDATGGGMSRHPSSSHAPIVPDGLPVQSGQHPQCDPTGLEFRGRTPRPFVPTFGRLCAFFFGAFAMTRTSIVLGVATIASGAAALSGCPGCGPERPAAPEAVHDVGPLALARDLPTAQAYAGRLVRVRLAAGTYEAAGAELRVRGSVPFSPPLLVFRCREAPPAGGVALVVTGRCGEPQRDGFWRTASADFCVTVSDCTAAPVNPSP
jgi:hypothetical protein